MPIRQRLSLHNHLFTPHALARKLRVLFLFRVELERARGALRQHWKNNPTKEGQLGAGGCSCHVVNCWRTNSGKCPQFVINVIVVGFSRDLWISCTRSCLEPISLTSHNCHRLWRRCGDHSSQGGTHFSVLLLARPQMCRALRLHSHRNIS